MIAGQKKENSLSSWKEIAAYLGCDERTCLRWEKKFGLPVHRLESSGKTLNLIYYEFDFHLEIKDVRFSHSFEKMHQDALRAGLVRSTLNWDYWENLKKGVLYFDGPDWTDRPSMSVRPRAREN